jgi:hypothetical protein
VTILLIFGYSNKEVISMSVVDAKKILEKIHLENKFFFESKEDVSSLTSSDYEKMYQLLWVCNLRIQNCIDLLEILED